MSTYTWKNAQLLFITFYCTCVRHKIDQAATVRCTCTMFPFVYLSHNAIMLIHTSSYRWQIRNIFLIKAPHVQYMHIYIASNFLIFYLVTFCSKPTINPSYFISLKTKNFLGHYALQLPLYFSGERTGDFYRILAPKDKPFNNTALIHRPYCILYIIQLNIIFWSVVLPL